METGETEASLKSNNSDIENDTLESELAGYPKPKKWLASTSQVHVERPLLPNQSFKKDERDQSVQLKFDAFFEEREKEKQKLYTKVIFASWTLVSIGTCLLFSIFIWSAFNIQAFLYVGVLGGAMNATCVCLASSVPTDEFDLDDTFRKNHRLSTVVTVILGILFTLFAMVVVVLPPYFGFIMLPFGLWVGMHNCKKSSERPRVAVSTKIASLWIMAYLPVFTAFLWCSFFPLNFNSLILIKSSSMAAWLATVNDNYSYRALFLMNFIIFFACFFLAMYSMWPSLSISNNGVPTKNCTLVLYEVWSTWLFSIGVSCTSQGPFLILTGLSSTSYVGPTQTVMGIVLLLPVLVLFVLGKRRCFGFVARYFELDVTRLQNDGSLLAALASSALITFSGDYWLCRTLEGVHLSLPGDIERKFWMRGQIIGANLERETIQLKVLVDFDDDQNPLWCAAYQRLQVVKSVRNDTSITELFDGRDFDAWKDGNFSKLAHETDGNAQAVVVTLSIPAEKSRLSILDYAVTNLRLFPSTKFSDELLLKSPRQLNGDKEKEKVFALSKKITVTCEKDKIDFFLSHSWTDEPSQKIGALRKYLQSFKVENSYEPSLWFDKVCIDQKNPNATIEALPIMISMCKKILILFSHSYVRRLWCVWELFSLFTFCNKEIAFQRIEIIPVFNDCTTLNEGLSKVIDELENFNIDNAHCFDPNEELKLRKIMFVIGEERLTRSVQEIANFLRQKVGLC